MSPLRFIFVLFLAVGLAAGQEAPSPAAGTSSKHTPSEITRLLARATAGNAKAQTALGQAYADGNGVTQNFDLALKWYHKAADQGDADAANALGVMYRTGSGVDSSKEEAVAWYREGARKGSGVAMFNLGVSYYNGDGLNVDVATAYAWFTLAKESGVKDAADSVTRMDTELRPSEINTALKTIAKMYAEGGEINPNDAESVRWYRAAAERGDKDAQVNLGKALIAGRGTPVNYVEGHKWCESAAKQASSAGQYCLGNLYRAGLGVQKDTAEAMKYLTSAARFNYVPAMRALAEMYETGEAGKVDRIESFLWNVRAAVSGDDQARDAAIKIKGLMDPAEWNKAQERMRQWGMDSQKVETFLGQSGKP
jgi:uncharacterized protein